MIIIAYTWQLTRWLAFRATFQVNVSKRVDWRPTRVANKKGEKQTETFLAVILKKWKTKKPANVLTAILIVSSSSAVVSQLNHAVRKRKKWIPTFNGYSLSRRLTSCIHYCLASFAAQKITPLLLQHSQYLSRSFLASTLTRSPTFLSKVNAASWDDSLRLTFHVLLALTCFYLVFLSVIREERCIKTGLSGSVAFIKQGLKKRCHALQIGFLFFHQSHQTRLHLYLYLYREYTCLLLYASLRGNFLANTHTHRQTPSSYQTPHLPISPLLP